MRPLAEFHVRSRNPDGLNNKCKECAADKDKERVEKNRQRLRAYIKARKGCKVCHCTNIKFLEFHHRDRNKKKYNVGSMLNRYSWPRILAEISKCDILCVWHHTEYEVDFEKGWRWLAWMEDQAEENRLKTQQTKENKHERLRRYYPRSGSFRLDEFL